MAAANVAARSLPSETIMPPSTLRLAVDIGGTFTDIVLETAERRLTWKLLTTPAAPEEAVVEGSRHVLKEAGARFADIGVFLHGTTLATNALIERKGAKTALIATEGFRDVIEIADEGRYDQYDVFIDKPKQLVPRALRFTVPERLDVHGVVRLPLDEAAVRAMARRLLDEGVEAVAIALIHSYANGAHEARIRDILAEMAPELAVTLSSEVCPEMREYERTSTAIANAYVQPMMAGYLTRLERRFAEEGFTAPIQLMTSGGALTTLDTAARFPVRLIESGPAGGAILAAHVAAERGEAKVLSFDMGGTTAKVSLITAYQPTKARSFEVDRQARFLKGSGLPLRIPVVEMVEIGAGGGSIARVDQLKRITVGPDSAGSVPGPAAYARGGTEPTVTDADLVLGKIAPERFAGGAIALAPDKAAEALDAAVGAPLGLETPVAAFGVVEIVDENMANAARVHAVERGVVVSDHTLIAFGGAAPLHAARLAEKLGIARVIIPADAGVGSAVGFLRAPAAYELVHSRFMRFDRFEAEIASELVTAMSAEAHRLASAAAAGRPLHEARLAYMRYAGQGHEIAVELPIRALAAGDVATLRSAFEANYRHLFERHIPGAAIEILSWAVLVSTDAAMPDRLPTVSMRPGPEPIGTRPVFDAASGTTRAVPLYERADLAAGATIAGPAIIVEDGTSTVLTPQFDAHRDSGGALVLTRKKGFAP